MARQLPRLRAVLFDRDEQALKIAGEDVKKAGLEDRIGLRKGNFWRDDLGSEYDLILLSSVLCMFSDDRNRALLNKVFQILRGGGRVVVKDYLPDEDKISPAQAAVFSVALLASTPGGRVYPGLELRNWLAEAGFEDIHSLPVFPMPLMIAKKPSPEKRTG